MTSQEGQQGVTQSPGRSEVSIYPAFQSRYLKALHFLNYLSTQFVTSLLGVVARAIYMIAPSLYSAIKSRWNVLPALNYFYSSTKMPNCIFCEIAAGRAPSHKVWENETHLAFLSIYPNTDGVTVVIPKKHFPSYAFELDDDVLCALVKAAKQVAGVLDASFENVGRTAMVFEGFGIDHVHAKLFPLHGTNLPEWKPINSTIRTFYNTYPGYVASHDGERSPDEALSRLAKMIRGENL